MVVPALATDSKCQATARGSGERCRQNVKPGKRFCKTHDVGVAGLEASNFKHGRYSSQLPGRFEERYQAALADKTLMDTRDQIAILDAILQEQLKKLDTGESGALWQRAQAALRSFEHSLGTEDAPTRLEALKRIMAKGADESGLLGEIKDTMRQQDQMIHNHEKRTLEMNQYITAEQVSIFVYALQEVLIRRVTDKGLLAHIASDLDELIARGHGGQPASGIIQGN